MDFMPDFEQALGAKLNDKKTPKKVKSVIPDEWFTWDREEINKRFCFNHEAYKEDIEFVVLRKK